MSMDEFDELADMAERGVLEPVSGTELRGRAAAQQGRSLLMTVTGTTALGEATRVALGRPRLDAAGPSQVWRVRAGARLDAEARAAADRRGITISQMVRDAVAAYLQAS